MIFPTAIESSKYCAKGLSEMALSFLFTGESDQKNPLHSDSSKMYGIILVKSRVQFSTAVWFFSVRNVFSEHSFIFSTSLKQSEARLDGASSRNARISHDGIRV